MPIQAEQFDSPPHVLALTDEPRPLLGPVGQSMSTTVLPVVEGTRRQEDHQQFRSGPSGELSARGFALYVGVDESEAQAAGTSVSAVARETCVFGQFLVGGLEIHAAVALGPANARGGALESVFAALGDPRRHFGQLPAKEEPAGGEAQAWNVGVVIDVSRRSVHLDGIPVRLTPVEFNLLTYLMGASMRAVGRQELLCHVWSDGASIPSDRTIDVHIRRLRNKLGRFSKSIRTERGAGYLFHAHPEIRLFTPEYVI